MKEKTKQILRYVACGLGGLALGIGLLGGLSMCATSGNKTDNDVNTILTTERVRHNEVITTQNGAYRGYTFSLSNDWDYMMNSMVVGSVKAEIWSVDTSTYNMSLDSTLQTSIGTANYGQDLLCTWITDYIRTIARTNYLRFLAVYSNATCYTDSGAYAYFTFIAPGGGVSQTMPFYKTGGWNARCINIFDTAISNSDYSGNYYIETNTITSVMMFQQGPNSNSLVNTYTFQDSISYFKSQGYADGYPNGYSEGYDDAYAEKDTGIAFTSCGVYPNAQVTLATDETIGNFKYMYLCHYITKPGYDEHTIYIMWTTNANTGQYLGEVIDRNDSDSYDPAVTLGSFTQQPTSSVTITATEDMEFGLWVGYITTFHNRGEITNSILWFQGGTSESDMQIYQNGYNEGYQNGNQEGQETGYEQGYDRGHEVGDAEGYSRGYTEGFNQTNTKNVFSLFTSAFDSVASFFDLKIFGFLPLYWFFLAPLFIALISLLMRMVKH